MSKRNDDFFEKKKTWSKVKDELLGCYLKPYVTKILHTHKPLVYIDCFAGKGKFADGEKGSPLIALDVISQCHDSIKLTGDIRIYPIFIDLHYANDLHRNLSQYPDARIVDGAYEDKIDNIIKSLNRTSNVFLYIDPYGIKALNCSKFDALSKKFDTIELLINMNSFGFIREGCRVLGTQFTLNDASFFDDLVEYDSTKLDASFQSMIALNRIAGGDYWKQIIERYKTGLINGYQAEEEFTKQYCQRLRQNYKFVLNMPIRIQQNQHAKYRMIHATNHPDGCVLMADNMCNRWELLKQIQDEGQLSLFSEDINNNIVDERVLRRQVMEHFSKYSNWIRLTRAQAEFFVEYGVICKPGDIAKILRNLEQENAIAVDRNPKYTNKGKLSSFMSESHGNRVLIKWSK